jgi:hypothetical protein
MPVFIDRQLNIYDYNPVIKLPEFKPSYIVSDTEFTKNKLLKVDCLGVYLPELIPDYLVVFTYEELSASFHPLMTVLQAYGYNVVSADEDSLMSVVERIQELFNEIIDCEKTTRQVNKQFRQSVNEGVFDHLLTKLNIEPECLSVEKDKHSGTYAIKLAPPVLDFSFLFFYGFADFFKIWGKDYQSALLDASIVQQRCLKFRNAHGSNTPLTEYNLVNGVLYQFDYTLREAMYRFPPRSKGLDAQTSIFEVTTRKINVKTWNIAKALGFENLNDVMGNFSHFLKTMPEEALKYHATDVFATWDLHLKQQVFYDVILQSFQMESIEVADTTGSNVSKFIVEGMRQEFGVYDKDSEKILKQIINLGQLDNLENSPLNDFGCQPFLTVGGLLYSRMAKQKFIKGVLSDCDLKSCYASSMSNMSVYLGEPVTLTCKYDKYKITLREALELVENQHAPDDGWFIRVSGTLDKAINTLVLSDLKFKPKAVKQQQLYEVSTNRKSVEKFNAFKTSKRAAQSTILTKQIKFGLITKATIEALKKLPHEWLEEYLNLKCDVVSFFPGKLIADNLTEYFTIRETLPEHDRIEKFDIKTGTKEIDSQRYKNNACLKFDIAKYWVQLKNKRGEFKKAKNPIQEVFKLFQNSGYGVLACLYLTTNNLMASNQITADARAGAWLMTNALNGFGAITDGTSYSNEHIPLSQTFHKILSKNPSYLEHFDDSIKSEIEITDNFNPQDWMDKNLNLHLESFYQVDSNDYNLKRFEYELKTEIFPTKKGDDWFLTSPEKVEEMKYELGTGWDSYLKKNGYTVETALFSKFYNNNSGNYCKGVECGEILINGEEYNIVESEPFVKARSFQGGDSKLINWYCDAITKGYTTPLIYSENKLIKFGDGNLLAIRFLETGSEHIAHPMGFDTVAYKMMKLVTRSQFLFQTELQLRNFETNEETLANLSKEIGLANKVFWDKLTAEDVAPYDIELREGIDYFSYAKGHPVGVGFELLALSPTAKGDINLVRQKIVELINEGCKNFNAGLNIGRNLDYGKPLKNLFASVIVAKKNAEDDLRLLLENSADEATQFSVRPENIKRLGELNQNNSEEE